MLDPFSLPFFQRGIVEVLLLAVAAGLLGTWIVLRGMAFFAHAVGTATFPGLVLADGLGFSATLGALGAALVMAALVGLLTRRRGTGADSVTALALAVTLALGVVLASDVFGSQARVDRLLFGSLLLIDGADLRLAAVAAVAVAVSALVIGPRWLAAGFAGGGRRGATDTALVVLVALVAVAALAAVGALLATALLVVPAATTRLVADRMRSWQLATVGLTAVEGVAGLWLSFQLDVPPGAAIAVLAGGVFALVAGGRALALARRPAPVLSSVAPGAA
jgi:ABC-type Mn2+/Zn2+ transport system permease subunit